MGATWDLRGVFSCFLFLYEVFECIFVKIGAWAWFRGRGAGGGRRVPPGVPVRRAARIFRGGVATPARRHCHDAARRHCYAAATPLRRRLRRHCDAIATPTRCRCHAAATPLLRRREPPRGRRDACLESPRQVRLTGPADAADSPAGDDAARVRGVARGLGPDPVLLYGFAREAALRAARRVVRRPGHRRRHVRVAEGHARGPPARPRSLLRDDRRRRRSSSRFADPGAAFVPRRRASAEYPRGSRGGAATRLRGISTREPRRRRAPSPRNLHAGAAAAPRPVSADRPRLERRTSRSSVAFRRSTSTRRWRSWTRSTGARCSTGV